MKLYHYKGLLIEILNQLTYNNGIEEDSFNYLRQYHTEGALEYTSSQHIVSIHQDKSLVNSCLLRASGGATRVHQQSSLLDGDQLLICCGDTVFCLLLPQLELQWKTKTDQITCFQIFSLQQDYLVHGETEITRLDREGKIQWQFSGKDIFVCIDGEEACTLTENYILLTDFEKTQYTIGFDGKLHR